MPELPEIETIRRRLAPEVTDRRLVAVRVHRDDILLDRRPPGAFREELTGRWVLALRRRAKFLLFHLSRDRDPRSGSNGDRRPGPVLESQLRMTGRYRLGSGAPPPECTHLAAEFDLDDGRTLYYDDVRRLGGFRLHDQEEAWRERERELGPEPLDDGFRPTDLEEVLAGSRAPIKSRLLDQRRIAGLGNIYTAEALHAAGLDPRRAAGDLALAEIRRLHGAIREVLRSALRQAGTTLRDYGTPDGGSGGFQHQLGVYGREGEACPRCGDLVHRIVQSGRATFFCPGCQG